MRLASFLLASCLWLLSAMACLSSVLSTVEIAEAYLDWRSDAGFGSGTARYDLGADIHQSDIDWGGNVDQLIVDIYAGLDPDDPGALSTANAKFYNRVIQYDGRMNVAVGGVAAAGVGLACAFSAGTASVVAAGAGVVGSADEFADGVVTLALGAAIENSYGNPPNFRGSHQ